MADIITRLRVDSSEYDAKLKRATDQLSRLEDELKKSGKSFTDATDKEVEFARSLGDMGTKATTAKGKVAEMTKAFTEMSMQYRRMTDEEKTSPYGKALAQSLDQLKTRIKSTSAELKDVSSELGEGSNGLGGILDAVAG
jgi:DNA repair exonuclease SbcCD ATPase subunit